MDVLSCEVDELSGKDLWRTSTQSIKGRAGSKHISTVLKRPDQPHHFKVRKTRLRAATRPAPLVQLEPGSTSPDRAVPHNWLEKQTQLQEVTFISYDSSFSL